MRLFRTLLLTLFGTFQFSQAATLPPAKILPPDTIALFSVPDWDSASTNWVGSTFGKLWQDPALKPFRDKVSEKWRDDSATPLQRQLGFKWTEFLDLLHGQLTLALTKTGPAPGVNGRVGLVLLVDTKDKQEALKARLADLKKKWIESGKQLKTETAVGVEVTTLIFSDEDLNKVLAPGSRPQGASGDSDLEELPSDNKAEKSEILMAQSGPLLIVANNQKDIERILAKQSDQALPSLADQVAYTSSHNALFREALAFAWVNFAPVVEQFSKQLGGAVAGPDAPASLHLDRLLAASGIGSINTLAARVLQSSSGSFVEVFASAPESRRRGLLSIVSSAPKEAGPPPFVTSDVTKFRRWRLDGQKTWAALENLLTSLSPEMAGLLQMALQAAGKDRDPNFDLKRTLIGNLGDDFISVQKSASNSSSSLYLIGSPHPEQVVLGLKASSALMPLAGGDANVVEREFLGRKIYSLALAPGFGLGDDRSPGQRHLNFAATAGYAAISTDAGLLEEYLRAGEAAGKSLKDKAGLSEAAQRVGGTATGLFGYANQGDAVRLWLEGNRGNGGVLDKLLSWAPLAGGKGLLAQDKQKLGGWLDGSTLPPFERISKYFTFIVYSLSSSSEGVSWKLFIPAPPLAP